MEQDLKRHQTFLLRLPVSVREQAAELAQRDGTSLNHFISLALAEKISRMEQHQVLTMTKATARSTAAPAGALRFARSA
jgi:hypothetical protein